MQFINLIIAANLENLNFVQNDTFQRERENFIFACWSSELYILYDL